MRTFKMGDKALCINPLGLDSVLRLNVTYEIEKVNDNGTLNLFVEDGEIVGNIMACRFVPVVEE